MLGRFAPQQLGDVDGDAPRFVLGQQVRRSASARLVLEVDIGQRVAVVIADDEAGMVRLIDGPRWRETASVGHNDVLRRECEWQRVLTRVRRETGKE